MSPHRDPYSLEASGQGSSAEESCASPALRLEESFAKLLEPLRHSKASLRDETLPEWTPWGFAADGCASETVTTGATSDFSGSSDEVCWSSPEIPERQPGTTRGTPLSLAVGGPCPNLAVGRRLSAPEPAYSLPGFGASSALGPFSSIWGQGGLGLSAGVSAPKLFCEVEQLSCTSPTGGEGSASLVTLDEDEG